MNDPAHKGGDAKVSLKFSPIQSFADQSFFAKLSKNKLHEYKLDSSLKPVWGFMTQPSKLTKFNTLPTINFDHESFLKRNSDALTKSMAGTILNVNTVEEFKAFDKKGYLQKAGSAMILAAETTGSFQVQYFILSFADLKKSVFYYWFAFPLLHSLWCVKRSVKSDMHESLILDALATSSLPFFQITKAGPIYNLNHFNEEDPFVYIDTCLSADGHPSAQLKNYLFMLALRGFETFDLIIHRNDSLSYMLRLQRDGKRPGESSFQITGWERNDGGHLGPKVADLSTLLDPKKLADQAVDLNLHLMKWRIARTLDLDIIKDQKVLLLGAGTLGCYVSRGLMGWGVRNITFVDSGRVSYSNPARQPLFSFKDCYQDDGRGVYKAARASEALREVFPGITSKGYNMKVPMIGHPVHDMNEREAKQSYEQLRKLFLEHDVIFLLMDSRESRWLPTVMGTAMNKLVLNAALGFDSYLVLRHSSLDSEDRVGCYFCSDVVAPKDSLSDRTLDQMCTVTRPGGAPIASAVAVELMMSILQHPLGQKAGASERTKFGAVPHQIRGYLHDFSQQKLNAPAYKHCSACLKTVTDAFNAEGWDFVKKCLNHPGYLEEMCGLKKVQEEAEKAAEALMEDLDLSGDELE